MMNRKGTRVLITTILAAALLIALGVEAHAARGSLQKKQTTTSISAPKPGVAPLAGEPDYPNGSPQPPKFASIPVGAPSNWAMRIQIMVQAWLAQQTIRRLP